MIMDEWMSGLSLLVPKEKQRTEVNPNYLINTEYNYV